MTAFKRSTLAASLAALTFGLTATADDGKPDSFRARLSSYNEVHFIAGNAAATPVVPPALRGAISSVASGSFRADIDDRSRVIEYTLSYRGLESPVRGGAGAGCRGRRDAYVSAGRDSQRDDWSGPGPHGHGAGHRRR